MSAEKISDLDKRISIQEASLNRVLEAVEKQANSTEKLNKSVTEMTVKLTANTDEAKELREDVRSLSDRVAKVDTEIAVIKRGNEWVRWAERCIVAAVMAGIVWAMKSS